MDKFKFTKYVYIYIDKTEIQGNTVHEIIHTACSRDEFFVCLFQKHLFTFSKKYFSDEMEPHCTYLK